MKMTFCWLLILGWSCTASADDTVGVPEQVSSLKFENVTALKTARANFVADGLGAVNDFVIDMRLRRQALNKLESLEPTIQAELKAKPDQCALVIVHVATTQAGEITDKMVRDVTFEGLSDDAVKRIAKDKFSGTGSVEAGAPPGWKDDAASSWAECVAWSNSRLVGYSIPMPLLQNSIDAEIERLKNPAPPAPPPSQPPPEKPAKKEPSGTAKKEPRDYNPMGHDNMGKAETIDKAPKVEQAPKVDKPPKVDQPPKGEKPPKVDKAPKIDKQPTKVGKGEGLPAVPLGRPR